jgi:hypothetical protein
MVGDIMFSLHAVSKEPRMRNRETRSMEASEGLLFVHPASDRVARPTIATL